MNTVLYLMLDEEVMAGTMARRKSFADRSYLSIGEIDHKEQNKTYGEQVSHPTPVNVPKNK
jgi:hypothetical protein